MKLFFICLILFLTLTLENKAQNDTLIINLKGGSIEKIAVSQIQTIKFENITGVNEHALLINNLAIKGNYPNPFGEFTNIEFEIGLPGNVEIIIFDNSGKKIQTLGCNYCQTGKNVLQWNCFDKTNNRVQSGVYFYEVHFGTEIQAKKMIIIGGRR